MLQGKIIIVTGGAGLIGQEFVNAIVENNGRAIIADISDEKIKELKKDVDFVKLDITSLESVRDMIDTVNKKYGKFDAVVNNAYPRNKNYGRKFEDVTYQDFCENTNLHLGGYFLVAQQCAEFFKKQGWGNIINMSSIYGVIPPRFEVYKNTKMTMPVEYAAIKAALIHITRYMAKYYKGSNIRFNCISPGGIYDSQPESFVEEYKKFSVNKGMLDKSDLKGALVFLLSDNSLFINGQNMVVDDGWSL